MEKFACMILELDNFFNKILNKQIIYLANVD